MRVSKPIPSRRLILTVIIVLASTVATARSQSATPVLESHEKISFDSPEAWAMKRSASLTLLTALGPPREREAGSLELALELGWNPRLGAADRRVGFDGTKEEDLNRLDVIPRPRILIGLGHNLTLELAYLPPIEVEGLTPNLLAAALERPMLRRNRWVLGARVHAQIGRIEGDITCPRGEASIPSGDTGNEFGCEEASDDEVSLNYVGFGLTGGYELAGASGSALNFGLFANHMDLEFQVDALTFGVRDRTKLTTDGWTYVATAGFSRPLSARVRLAIEAFYSPLARRGANEPLFNLRSLLSYAL